MQGRATVGWGTEPRTGRGRKVGGRSGPRSIAAMWKVDRSDGMIVPDSRCPVSNINQCCAGLVFARCWRAVDRGWRCDGASEGESRGVEMTTLQWEGRRRCRWRNSEVCADC